MAYSLVLLLGLLTPSIYWDHYAVVALWPLLACYARLAPRVRTRDLALFVLLVLPLGCCPDGPLAIVLLATTIWVCAGSILLISLIGRRYLPAPVWGTAAALMFGRFPFDLPAFRHGAGLVAMSAGLWGTLLLFALCVVNANGPRTAASELRRDDTA